MCFPGNLPDKIAGVISHGTEFFVRPFLMNFQSSIFSTRSRVGLFTTVMVLASVAGVAQEAKTGREDESRISFARDIKPIFRNHCYDCHAGSAEEGGLNLGIKSRALAGGESKSPLVPGHGEKSLIVKLISGAEIA